MYGRIDKISSGVQLGLDLLGLFGGGRALFRGRFVVRFEMEKPFQFITALSVSWSIVTTDPPPPIAASPAMTCPPEGLAKTEVGDMIISASSRRSARSELTNKFCIFPAEIIFFISDFKEPQMTRTEICWRKNSNDRTSPRYDIMGSS